MENFLIVQCVELRGAQRSKKSAEIRSCQRYLRSSCTAAWPHATQLPSKAGAENERPVRGDNRTGQAIWALGVDGRSRLIQPMGRDYRSHIDKSQHPRRTFNTPGDFFNLLLGAIAAKITAQQAISRRLRPTCPTRSTAGSHSAPGSRKRYRRTDRAPAFFLPQACLKPRQAEPPAQRSPR